MRSFIHELDVPTARYTRYLDGSSDSTTLEHSVGLDYIAECDKTASNVFTGDNVLVSELVAALRRFQTEGENLNRYKKALFRKQSREEAGLLMVGNFDPNGLTLGSAAVSHHDDLFHGVIGIATEAGELAEFLADALEGKRRFDVENVREEAGDVLWYMTRLLKWAGTTFLTEMKRNIAKLRARHGAGGFNKERDMNRDLNNEAQVLHNLKESQRRFPTPSSSDHGDAE